jgi:hypothetical protein
VGDEDHFFGLVIGGGGFAAGSILGLGWTGHRNYFSKKKELRKFCELEVVVCSDFSLFSFARKLYPRNRYTVVTIGRPQKADAESTRLVL